MTPPKSSSDWALQLAAVNRAVDEHERILLSELAEARNRFEQAQSDSTSLRLRLADGEIASGQAAQALADRLDELKALRERCELLESESSRAALLATAATREGVHEERVLRDRLAAVSAELLICRKSLEECVEKHARLDEQCEALKDGLRREAARAQDLEQSYRSREDRLGMQLDASMHELSAMAAGHSELLKSLSDLQRDRDATLVHLSAALEGQLRADIAAHRAEADHLRAVAASLETELRAIDGSFWGRLIGFRRRANNRAPLYRDTPAGEITRPAAAAPLSPAPTTSFTASSATQMAMNSTLQSSEPVRSAQELLNLHDENFVRAAYLSLLRRPVDPNGFEHYLGQIRQGANRSAIVAELARSPEGRLRRLELPGMAAVLRSNSRFGSLWRRLLRKTGISSGTTLASQLRQIENSLYRMANANSLRFDRLESDATMIKNLLQLGSPSASVAAASGGATPAHRTSIVANRIVFDKESPQNVLGEISKRIADSEEASLLSR